MIRLIESLFTALVRFLILGLVFMGLTSPAHAQFGPDGTYSLPCTLTKSGACIGIIMHNDGTFWISEYHYDSNTWTDIKPADCPNWNESHVRRLSVTDPVYGDYRCQYDMSQPTIVEAPIKEGRGAKLKHYIDTHKMVVLVQDPLVIVGQSVWALKAIEYRHTDTAEAVQQSLAISISNVAGNHLWRWLVNKNGMNDGDKYVSFSWVAVTSIVSWGRVYDYEHGSNTVFPPSPPASPRVRVPHYRD